MKKVLFVSITEYDFKHQEKVAHLTEKFEGLSHGAHIFVIARGRPFYQQKWGCHFYLFPTRFLFFLGVFKIAFWLCLFKKIDVIIAQSPLTEGFISTWLKKFFKNKELIVEAHGDWQEGPFLNKKRIFVGLQRKLIPKIARFSLKNADKIRAISNFTKEKALEIAGNKPCYVFPTFTDLTLFLNEPNSVLGDYILFVGVLEPVKGLKYLIKAMKEVRPPQNSRRSDLLTKLVIVGEGKERGDLERLARELGLADRVEFKGRLSLKETKDIMKDCYCLVLPSLSEGLGRVLLEAGALGKPLIGSRTGGIPDIIKNNQNGFLVEPKNSQDLARKIQTLLNNKDLALKMGQQSRKLVERNFSNQRYVSAYLEMINS